MGISPADGALMKQLALQLGFPRDDASLARSLSGEDGAMIDLLPEIATLRDVAFYLKASMVPSLDALPELRGWSPEDAKLSWRWKDGKFDVKGFGGTLHCGGWLEAVPEDAPPNGEEEGGAATPRGKYGAEGGKAEGRRLPRLGVPRVPAALQKLLGRAPKPRLPPSAADPSHLVGSPLETEDDVLHVRHLPDFNGNLRPADAEVLLQVSRDPFTAPRRADCHHAPR